MEDNISIKKLVNPGLPYVGEAISATIGAIIGSVGGSGGIIAGAIGGKIVSDLFTKTGEEIEKRYLSRRESIRIGIAAIYAVRRIKINEEKNLPLRKDDFFAL